MEKEQKEKDSISNNSNNSNNINNNDKNQIYNSNLANMEIDLIMHVDKIDSKTLANDDLFLIGPYQAYYILQNDKTFNSMQLFLKKLNNAFINNQISIYQLLEWYLVFLSEGLSREKFKNYIDSLGGVSRCVCKWNGKHTAYRCKDCGITPSSCICIDCFDMEVHKNHSFALYTSSLGGCCDCGDLNSWKSEGFCNKHKIIVGDPLLNYSSSFIKRLTVIFSNILDLLLKFPTSSDFVLICNWLNEIGGYSDGIRRILWNELVNISNFGANKTYLELLFSVKLNLPEESLDSLTNLYMQLFFDPQFKIIFGDLLMKYYRLLVLSIPQKPEIGKALDKLTVQIFTVKELTCNLIQKDIFEIIVESLYEFLSIACNTDGKLSLKSSLITKRLYLSITHDIKFILDHNEVVPLILEKESVIDSLLKLLNIIDNMDEINNIPSSQDHIAFENEQYAQPFFLLEAILDIFDSFFKNWSSLNTRSIIFLFKCLMEKLISYDVIDLNVTSTRPNSFHRPYHRIFSSVCLMWLQSHNNNYDGLFKFLDSILSSFLSDDNLCKIVLVPLQSIIQLSEYRSGLWVRNGLDVARPSYIYAMLYWKDSYLDNDLFFILICKYLLRNDNIFFKLICSAFNFDYNISCIDSKASLLNFYLFSSFWYLLYPENLSFCTRNELFLRDSVYVLSIEDNSFSNIVDRISMKSLKDDLNIRDLFAEISDTYQLNSISQNKQRININGWKLFNFYSLHYSEKERSMAWENFTKSGIDYFSLVSERVLTDHSKNILSSKFFQATLFCTIYNSCTSKDSCFKSLDFACTALILIIKMLISENINNSFVIQQFFVPSKSDINVSWFFTNFNRCFFENLVARISIGNQSDFNLLSKLYELYNLSDFVIYKKHINFIFKMLSENYPFFKIYLMDKFPSLLSSALEKNVDKSEKIRKAKERQMLVLKSFDSKRLQFSSEVETYSDLHDSNDMQCSFCLSSVSASQKEQLNAIALLKRHNLSLPKSIFGIISNELLPLLDASNITSHYDSSIKTTESNHPKHPNVININSKNYFRSLSTMPDLNNFDYLNYELNYLNYTTAVKSRLCGHYIHSSCYEKMISFPILDSKEKLDIKKQEFFCPFCRQLSNALIPVIHSSNNPIKNNILSSDSSFEFPCSNFSSSSSTKQSKSELVNLFQDILNIFNLHLESLTQADVISLFNSLAYDAYNDKEYQCLDEFNKKSSLRILANYLQIYFGSYVLISTEFAKIGNYLNKMDDWIFCNDVLNPKITIKLNSLFISGREIFLSLLKHLKDEIAFIDIAYRYDKQQNLSLSIFEFVDSKLPISYGQSIRFYFNNISYFIMSSPGSEPWSLLYIKCYEMFNWNKTEYLVSNSIDDSVLFASSISPFTILCFRIIFDSDVDLLTNALNDIFIFHCVHVFNCVDSWIKSLDKSSQNYYYSSLGCTNSVFDNLSTIELPDWFFHTFYWLSMNFLRQSSILIHSIFYNNTSNFKNNFGDFCSIASEYNYLCDYLKLDPNLPFELFFLKSTSASVDKFKKFLLFWNSDKSLPVLVTLPIINELIKLPMLYQPLYTKYLNKICSNCGKIPIEPAICLICQEFICVGSKCCAISIDVDEKHNSTVGEAFYHSQLCGFGNGIFLLLRLSNILILFGNKSLIWGSLYLDENGEEDIGLKRGKALYLNNSRYQELNKMQASSNLEQLFGDWKNRSYNF